jgi:signal transduction histidine kinase
MNTVIVSNDELSAIMRALIKDVIARSRDAFDNLPETVKLVASGQSFAGSIRSLVAEKHALVQKIVDQQEAIQGQLARELHDSVLGNIMLLRRSLSGAKRMDDDEVMTVLDEIAQSLRDVCQDLSPRDLKDLGLQPILEELCHNLEARTHCECVMECATPIPEFPQEVSLHIYRIAQECFNNIANHASATMVKLAIAIENDKFTMSVSDNGVGFDAAQPAANRRARVGGTGAGIMKERAELIGYSYPAKVWVESQPGKGTRTVLQVTMSPISS